MEIEVDDMRQVMIDAFQLRRTDEKFTFYYDETNNIRKFYLTKNGTNVPEHKNFVLGGIALAQGQRLPDIGLLREKLRMQSNAPEIKFAHVAKGDFEHVLASNKLATVLSWIIEHEILIHYSSVNIIYWAIVDIIDSILVDDEKLHQFHEPMKNELYRAANGDKPAFLSLLKRHRYPDVQRGKVADFIGEIDAFVGARVSANDNLPSRMLKALVKKSASLPDLVFLANNDEDMLIKSFDNFYMRPILLFKNAIHVFDQEIEIEKSLSDIQFKNGAENVNFSFSDSKKEPGIQIADVVTGFLGKYQSFVEEHPLPELMNRKKSWNKIQNANFGALRQLIDMSDAASNAFIHRITAMDSGWKNDAFLHDMTPMRHLI
ncbi:DUF3800 domain-containing protein [Caballeronia sp. 15715]|uniref:DUF3800 domain-containing protein n=1 Tax=Caballeronia sp. 15715 TaxID=3391030 RepID=UPI0039E2E952